MCSCRCESLGPAALFGFSFPRACLLSSLKTSCALKPSQQLVTCSQVTSLVLEVLHGWNLILYVNRVPACLQQRESNVCCSHKCPGFPPWKPKLMQSWDYLAGLLSGFIKLLESAEMRLCSFGISVKRKVSAMWVVPPALELVLILGAVVILLVCCCAAKILHMQIRNKFLVDFEY